MNEWTIAYSSNLLHSLTHAERERKRTHYRYIYDLCASNLLNRYHWDHTRTEICLYGSNKK
jgi:hypothetical protein